MQIDKTYAFNGAGAAREVTRIQAQEIAPMDSYSPSDAKKAFRMVKPEALFETQGLGKKSMHFRARSFATSPDGTVCIAYAASKPEKDDSRNKGYIAAVSPRGEIKWESPVKDEGLCSVKVGSDGIIYGQTGRSLRALNPDGTVKFEHRFEESVNSHCMDSSGNHYFVSSKTNEFYIVDSQGNRKAIPEGMKGVKAHEVEQVSPDLLAVRYGKAISLVDLKAGITLQKHDFEKKIPQRSDWSQYIDHFNASPDGSLRIWIQNTFVDSSPFGDSGSHTGFFMQDSVVNDLSLVKADQSGNVLWRIESLGDFVINAGLPDGSLLFSYNRKEYASQPGSAAGSKGAMSPTGKVFVGKIGADGKKDDSFFAVQEPLRRMYSNPENGTVLILHGDSQLSEYDSSGALLRSHRAALDQKLYPAGPSGKEYVILKDLNEASVYSMDMRTGEIQCLTELELDLSARVICRELENQEEESGGGKVIEQSEDHIDVDGVKLPINQ